MLCKPDREGTMYGCSENTHFHDPGSGDGGGHRSLATVAMVGRGGDASPIDLADWFAPATGRSSTLLLVCRSVHLHRRRDASAYRRAGLPGQRGTLSVGA